MRMTCEREHHASKRIDHVHHRAILLFLCLLFLVLNPTGLQGMGEFTSIRAGISHEASGAAESFSKGHSTAHPSSELRYRKGTPSKPEAEPHTLNQPLPDIHDPKGKNKSGKSSKGFLARLVDNFQSALNKITFKFGDFINIFFPKPKPKPNYGQWYHNPGYPHGNSNPWYYSPQNPHGSVPHHTGYQPPHGAYQQPNVAYQPPHVAYSQTWGVPVPNGHGYATNPQGSTVGTNVRYDSQGQPIPIARPENMAEETRPLLDHSPPGSPAHARPPPSGQKAALEALSKVVLAAGEPPNAKLSKIESLPGYVATNHYIRGDGNCMFRVFAHFMSGDQENHLAARAEVVNHIKENADDFRNFISAEEVGLTDKAKPTLTQIIDAYIDRMSQNTVWGDHIPIEVWSKKYNYNIALVSESDNSIVTHLFCSDPNSKEPWVGMYYKNEHYELLFHDPNPNSQVTPQVPPQVPPPQVSQQVPPRFRPQVLSQFRPHFPPQFRPQFRPQFPPPVPPRFTAPHPMYPPPPNIWVAQPVH